MSVYILWFVWLLVMLWFFRNLSIFEYHDHDVYLSLSRVRWRCRTKCFFLYFKSFMSIHENLFLYIFVQKSCFNFKMFDDLMIFGCYRHHYVNCWPFDNWGKSFIKSNPLHWWKPLATSLTFSLSTSVFDVFLTLNTHFEVMGFLHARSFISSQVLFLCIDSIFDSIAAFQLERCDAS